MKILITGGAGFIGSHIAEYFQYNADVRILDNRRTGNLSNLEGLKCDFLEGSILDESAVERAVKGVEVIFHMAALISVPESMFKPKECEEINILGLLNTLQAAERAGVRKLVLASSAAVYGDNPEVPKRESMLPEPLSPYAISKLAGEHYCDMFSRRGHLQTASLRFFNVFGPRQDPSSAYAAAVPIFIREALANRPITIYGTGDQTRDFVYVRDIVAAAEFVGMHPSITGAFNIGYGKSTSILSLAKKIITECGSSSEIYFASCRPGDIANSTASIDKITNEGFQHAGGLDQGLSETIAYFKRKF